MYEPSQHKEAIKNLQLMLKTYDMSFGISNKMFRIAIVLEILNVQSLFEQLLNKWQNLLPLGEGPDADINFEYWSNYDQWADLVNAARQNVCIENLPIDCGNGEYIDDCAKYFKKVCRKNVASVFRNTFKNRREDILDSFKVIADDKEGVLAYGDMVFHAIIMLLSTLREISTLLKNPSENQLLVYYNTLDNMFLSEYRKIDIRIADIHKSELPQKKKENNLKAYRDELINDLIRSKVLDRKLEHCNTYDVKDFMDDHKDEFSEEPARIIVTVDEFGDLSKDTTKIKIARYLFEQRHEFPAPSLNHLFAYLHGFPLVNKHLGYVIKVTEDKGNVTITVDTNREQRTIPKKPLSGIEAGIFAVYEAKMCKAADWAVVVKILEELGEWQTATYKVDAERINEVCGENVTTASSLSRSPIYTKITGKYPEWKVKPDEQNRETAGKLQTYLKIGEIFMEGKEG